MSEPFTTTTGLMTKSKAERSWYHLMGAAESLVANPRLRDDVLGRIGEWDDKTLADVAVGVTFGIANLMQLGYSFVLFEPKEPE